MKWKNVMLEVRSLGISAKVFAVYCGNILWKLAVYPVANWGPQNMWCIFFTLFVHLIDKRSFFHDKISHLPSTLPIWKSLIVWQHWIRADLRWFSLKTEHTVYTSSKSQAFRSCIFGSVWPYVGVDAMWKIFSPNSQHGWTKNTTY